MSSIPLNSEFMKCETTVTDKQRKPLDIPLFFETMERATMMNDG